MNWYKIAKKEPKTFQELMETADHYNITCENCGGVHKCRCIQRIHDQNPPVKATVNECPDCEMTEADGSGRQIYTDDAAIQKRPDLAPSRLRRRKKKRKKASKEIPGYPYYLAIHSEGRLKGQYPNEIGFVPNLRKQWDKGGFGTGKKTTEFKSENVDDLLMQLQQRHINPRFDVDFYVVRRPNSHRERMQYPVLLREKANEKSE